MYSTIFAAAVVVDAKFKKERRDQWNAAFSNVIQEIEEDLGDLDARYTKEKALKDDHPQNPYLLKVDSWWKQLDSLQSIDGISGMQVFQDWEPSWNPLPDADEFDLSFMKFDGWGSATDCPELSASTGDDLNRNLLPPQSLWATDRARQRAIEHGWWTPKKLRMSEAMATRYALHCLLILHSQYPKSIRQANPDQFPETFRKLLVLTQSQCNEALVITKDYIQQLYKVPSDSSEIVLEPPNFFPSYNEDSANEYHHVRTQLNQAILSSVHRRESNELTVGSMILHIAHNLMVSTAAPDVRTYNILITSLSRLRQDKLVDCAIANVMYTPIRPNEITCSAILNFYSRRNRVEDFTNFTARMRGIHVEDGKQRGLMMAQPYLSINDENKSRLIRRSDGQMIQKVYPTPMVFNSLIKGVLKFAGFRRALQIYRDLHEDGWGLDTDGLSVMLYDCLVRRDWTSGIAIWEQIQTLLRRHRSKKLAMSTYDVMLALCQVCEQKRTFREVFTQATSTGYAAEALKKRALKLVLSTPVQDSGTMQDTEPEVEEARQMVMQPRTLNDTQRGENPILSDSAEHERNDDRYGSSTGEFFCNMGAGTM